VSNGKDIILAPKQIQAPYTDVMHWEELIDFIDKNADPKEPYSMTSLFKFTLEQAELEEQYMGLNPNGQIIMEPIYDQISYNCGLRNAFKLKLGYHRKILLFKIRRVPETGNAKHILRLATVIPASRVQA
jgi:hypothetical protein